MAIEKSCLPKGAKCDGIASAISPGGRTAEKAVEFWREWLETLRFLDTVANDHS
jgi:hypothetical protein